MTLLLLGVIVALLAGVLYVLTSLEDVVLHWAARPVLEPVKAPVPVVETPVSRVPVWTASVVDAVPQVTVHLLDADELVCQHTVTVPARSRRPTMAYDGQVFAAARQTATGAWLYRLDPRA